MWEALLNFLFPPRCPLCHAYVEERGDWCGKCQQETLQLHRLPLARPMCTVIAEAWAFGVYRGGLRDLIRALKYQGRRSTLPYINKLLQAGLEKPQLPQMLAGLDIAMAVPLHKTREKQRGFNQAELIFKDFLQQAGLSWQSQLLRQRPTESMYKLGEQERRQNVKNAFAVQSPAAVTGKNILLVDDIMTTGATLQACAEVLKAAGASKICALVLASDHQ